jgi:hypothetical protein
MADWTKGLGLNARELSRLLPQNGYALVPSESIIRDRLIRVDPEAFGHILRQ